MNLVALFSKVAGELRPMPDRAVGTVRITLASLLVVVVMLTFRNKLIDIGPFMVFMLMQRNTLMTRLLGVLFIVSLLLGSLVIVGIAMFAWDLAWLRISLMGIFFWCCYYFINRVPQMSIIAIPSLTLLSIMIFNFDQYPVPNYIISQLGWIWAAFGLAYLATLLVQWVVGAPSGVEIVRDDIRRQLTAAEGSCLDRCFGLEPSHARKRSVAVVASLARNAEATLEMIDRLVKMKIVSSRQAENCKRAIVAGESVGVAALSPAVTAPRAAWMGLASRLRALRIAVLTRKCRSASGRKITLSPPLVRAGESLERAEAGVGLILAREEILGEPAALRPPEFGNADFANRATIATMACYFFASLTEWSGIHTCMITCAVTALSRVDAQTSKQWQRIIGASLGGLMSLVAMVFMIPYGNGLTGILLIVGGGTALCAWVSSGREAVSYLGWQMALAFYMTILQEPHATTDLGVLRDRVVGIFLGIIAMQCAFLWFTPKGQESLACLSSGEALN